MTRSDIIELANQYTERKGEKILNMPLIFSSTCIDICKRGRHWWRKWNVTFTINPGLSGAGITTFDFTSIVTTPALVNVAVEEIVDLSLILQSNPFQTVSLTPIFDPLGVNSMKQNVTQAQPSRYTMDPNDWKTLRLDPPDLTYTAMMQFWAMPNLNLDDASNNVPVIPPWNHNIIVEGMEMRINKRVYGANDARYRDSRETYEASILTMMMRPQFTTNYTRQWTDDSTGQGAAVQSTSPNSP